MLSNRNPYRLTGLPADTPAKELRQALRKLALRAKLDEAEGITTADIAAAERRLEVPVERLFDRLGWDELPFEEHALTLASDWFARLLGARYWRTLARDDAELGFEPAITDSQLFVLRQKIERCLYRELHADLEERLEAKDLAGAGSFLGNLAETGIDRTALYKIGKTAVQEAVRTFRRHLSYIATLRPADRLAHYERTVAPLLLSWRDLSAKFPQLEPVLAEAARRPAPPPRQTPVQVKPNVSPAPPPPKPARQKNPSVSPSTPVATSTTASQASSNPASKPTSKPTPKPTVGTATQISDESTVAEDIALVFECLLAIIGWPPVFWILFLSGAFVVFPLVLIPFALLGWTIKWLVKPTPRGEKRSDLHDVLDILVLLSLTVGPLFLIPSLGVWSLFALALGFGLAPFYQAWAAGHSWGEMAKYGRIFFPVCAMVTLACLVVIPGQSKPTDSPAAPEPIAKAEAKRDYVYLWEDDEPTANNEDYEAHEYAEDEVGYDDSYEDEDEDEYEYEYEYEDDSEAYEYHERYDDYDRYDHDDRYDNEYDDSAYEEYEESYDDAY